MQEAQTTGLVLQHEIWGAPTETRRAQWKCLLSIWLISLSPAVLALPPSAELANLNGSNGFVLNGVAEDDGSGWSVSGAGDVNRDGIDDFIIGAYTASPNGTFSGAGYVVFGGSHVGRGGAIELAELGGANGFVLNGEAAGDSLGFSVGAAGDVNADGIDDLIIGAIGASRNGSASGASYVVFGGTGVGVNGSLEMSELDGTDGFVLNGVTEFDFSGCSVAAGDVNGDGVSDLIIGSSDADPNGANSGASYVVLGRSGLGDSGSLELAELDGVNGFVINGVAEGDRSGFSVGNAGDVNGDGVTDFSIGAVGAGRNGNASGASYIVFGDREIGGNGILELAELDPDDGFVLNGVAEGDGLGGSVSGAGDVNSDGIDDFIVGASRADPSGYSSGASYVVFGSPEIGARASLKLTEPDGANAFVLNGVTELDQAGDSVSSAGDVNGDGFDDFIIGASRANSNGHSSGTTYVVFGKPGIGSGGSLELAGLDGANAFVLKGVTEFNRSGFSVSGAGDVNGDGVDDLIIGAHGAKPNGLMSGASYVVFGRDDGPDRNNDGCIDRLDYEILMADIGGPEPNDPAHDLNGDGEMNWVDVRMLFGLFSNPGGIPCGSSE